MTTDNENLSRTETTDVPEETKAPWNSRFGSDENLKQRKYSRISRNQPVKEASKMSKVLLGILVLTVITPFVLYWFVKTNTPANNNTPQTAQSLMITKNKSEDTTTVSKDEETTTSGTFVQNGNNENSVSSADTNQTTVATSEAEVVTEAPVVTEPAVVTEAPTPTEQTHVIAAGETWYGIARTYGVDVNALAAANGSTTDSPIYPGNTLIIP